MDFQDKRVLIAGLARSGLAAARLLCGHGAKVLLYDQKMEMPAAQEAMNDLPVEWHLGDEPLALALSCDLTVLSPGIPVQSAWIVDAKARGKEIIGEMELGYLMSRGTLIAITGTNGKTTTTSLVGELFKNAGKLTHVVGNIGNPITSVADDTHPDDVIVVEVSSFQLETIESFRPTVSAVLNITEDHLNRHGTMQEYIRLKARIFENQRAGDFVVLNWDDATVRAMAKQAVCKAIFFSAKEIPPIGAWVEDGKIFYGSRGDDNVRALCDVTDVRIPGAHNLQNALCASAIAMALNVPPPVVRHTLRTFAGVEHRIETVRELSGVKYINDSKGTNVDSSVKAVEAMDRPTVLIAGGYDKHTDFSPFAAAIAAGKIQRVVLLGETADQIEAALLKCGYEAVLRAHTMKEAVESARAEAVEGGAVLLSPACASFDMYEDYEARGRDFKRIVAELRE